MPLTDKQFDQVITLLHQVSDKIIRPYFKRLSSKEIREKNPGDFVTVADEKSEIFLTENLKKILPNSLVVGEEACENDPSILNLLEGEHEAVWVIDPVDGTYNFAHGRSHFGILLSLVEKGQTTYGWLYDVPGERVAYAIKGEGAYLRCPAKEQYETRLLFFHQPPALSEMIGQVGGGQAWHFGSQLNNAVKELRNTRCSLHDFLKFGLGEADFVYHKQTKPWDHTAPVLFIEECGGYTANLSNREKYNPTFFGQIPILSTMNKENWDEISNIILSQKEKVA